jgi:DNA-binding NarL/FixJ family response regulator
MRAAAESCHAPAVLLANRVDDDLDVLSEHRVVSLLLRDATDVGSLVRMVVDVARQGVIEGEEVQRRLRLQADLPSGDHSPSLGGPSEPVLTPREIEVLRLIADGWETSAIAGELCYAERTVTNIIHGITSRLRFRNRTQAVAHALRTGLI